MKTTYARKSETTRLISAMIFFIVGGGVIFYIGRDNGNPARLSIMFMFIYFVTSPLLALCLPCARISERNVLKVIRCDSYDYKRISVHTITKIDEDRKKNVKVSYISNGFIFRGAERSVSIPVHDKDKERLITDLLSINPRIEVKQPLGNLVSVNNDNTIDV
jgi:hypothetical protein